MTKHANDAKDQFERTLDFLLEDVDRLTDAEVEEELRLAFGDVSAADAAAARALMGAKRAGGAARLARAKMALAGQSRADALPSVSGAEAKAAVLGYWRANPGERPITMAARNGQTLSESDALEVYRSLLALGLISEPSSGQ
ncbi:hypothetical protein J2T07_001609 [Luteibacter jiangsuensis]|uniref:Uncharacterized protein n=1 Tax=Luteibacter jiangsuensis TaxID=637577 RepID=A0ABT9SZN8_9GAMM|nr:hypothetical protein [Luteibacter jiangsuensis]MDQ0009432.1 hypothetical protein [Luteibacter jiangsuensis]